VAVQNEGRRDSEMKREEMMQAVEQVLIEHRRGDVNTEDASEAVVKVFEQSLEESIEEATNLFGLFKHPEATEVCSDSQLVIRQLNGEYAVKSRELLPYWLRVKARVEKLGHEVKFTSISKEDNTARRILG